MSDSTGLLILLLGLAWIWWDSRGVAERATIAARSYCGNAGVTFLNDTVSWKKLRLQRNHQGRIQLQRTYSFDFSSDMRQQYHGEIVMMGKKVASINLDAFRVQ